ncbi:MAG: 50S ribosomal protein L13 [Candidatus Pacearchaeota archaeon]|nr:50S ribosomal protein L13 [Candidatus Pacearchaeota archaeon]MDE1848550.1 50S ribosomal protein L13 [Nanoarchaeota archaeon]
MRIIDGTDAVLGRIASYVARLALRGEEIRVINCENILVTGNRKVFIRGIEEKRRRVGSTQKGPKYSRKIERIVKTTIRGMLPDYREGRGREAFKRVKCYLGIPKEFEGSEMERMKKRMPKVYNKIGDILQ